MQIENTFYNLDFLSFPANENNFKNFYTKKRSLHKGKTVSLVTFKAYAYCCIFATKFTNSLLSEENLNESFNIKYLSLSGQKS